MDRFEIEGGYSLSGEYVISGNKNEALPIIAACLLTDEPVLLKNVPEIEDVKVMLKIIENFGVEVTRLEKGVYKIWAKDISNFEVSRDLARRIRASILLSGSMIARYGKLILPPPGGDVIGRRRLDTHFDGLKSLGVRIGIGMNYFFEKNELIGTEIFLDEQSVTATENIIMASVLAKGETTIFNAALEPHVQGLCKFLNKMGAKISGIGTNLLKIEGVSSLSGCEYEISGDYLEAGSIIGLAAVTNSEINIIGAPVSDMKVILRVFERLGITTYIYENTIFVPKNQNLVIKSDYHGAIPKIDDAPWPQFPTDLMSIAIVVATQARGTILFFERMYEGRMFFIDSLMQMGARTILCDPHRVVVVGPSELYGTTMESPDIRAGMALLIAGLCARGKSTIYNVRQIDRGYEKIDEKLNRLGAKIKRISE